MTFGEALTFVIEDGVEAARGDYSRRPDQRLKLDGAVAGFEACRGQDPAGLAALLHTAHTQVLDAYREKAPDYWFWRCREAEIEWVCNVMSAILLSQGQPVIVQPTVRGVLKAADIVGYRNSMQKPSD